MKLSEFEQEMVDTVIHYAHKALEAARSLNDCGVPGAADLESEVNEVIRIARQIDSASEDGP